MTWPINDLPSLDAMLAIGVSGIISDEPDVLAQLLARGGG
jgi:glycerophosphoryl diester phosphodiesterase